MCKYLVGFLFFVLSSAIWADEPGSNIETVVVEGRALVGIWKIDIPSYAAMESLGEMKWGPLREQYCRFENTDSGLRGRCLGALHIAMSPGEVDLKGADIHIAWGNMFMRLVLDGTLRAAVTFDGRFAAKISGIRYDDTQTAHASKQVLTDMPPDFLGYGDTFRRAFEQRVSGSGSRTPYRTRTGTGETTLNGLTPTISPPRRDAIDVDWHRDYKYIIITILPVTNHIHIL